MQSSVHAAVEVRATTPEDVEGLRGMFSRLSPRTIYLRFQMPYPRVPDWALGMFLNTDRHGGESLVATAGDEVVGHAMFVGSEGGREAEAAIVVEDSWQSRGIGKLLLCRLAEAAGRRGIETLTFEVLGENRRMLGLADAVFAESRREARGGSFRVRAALRTSGCAA